MQFDGPTVDVQYRSALELDEQQSRLCESWLSLVCSGAVPQPEQANVARQKRLPFETQRQPVGGVDATPTESCEHPFGCCSRHLVRSDCS